MNTTMTRSRIGGLQIAIILLAIATAAIHLYLGLQFGLTLFILNAIGYVGLVTLLYLPQLSKYQGWIRWALIIYTAITVIGWILRGERNFWGYSDKLIEIALIVLLFIESRR